MNDLFGKALTALPVYIGQVLSLLSGPKRFVLARDMESPQAESEAYTFLGVTIFLTLIAQVSMLPEQKDYLLTFASFAVMAAINLTLMSGALYLAWRLVGGTLGLRTFFTVSCYFSGISTLIFAAFTLLGGGVLRMLDPEGAAAVFNGGLPSDPGSAGYVDFSRIAAAGLVAVCAWIIVVWGAYRRLNNLSRTRSAIALVVFLALTPLLMGIQTFMQANVMLSRDRAAVRHFPADLSGLWKANDVIATDRGPPTEASTYMFYEGGEYFSIHMTTASQGGCATMTLENASGHATADGAMLTLAQTKHSATSLNGCSGQKTEKPLPTETNTYAYEVRHLPAGWLLCLSGRYGQECLAARAN
jgi:hypothetical protein